MEPPRTLHVPLDVLLPDFFLDNDCLARIEREGLLLFGKPVAQYVMLVHELMKKEGVDEGWSPALDRDDGAFTLAYEMLAAAVVSVASVCGSEKQRDGLYDTIHNGCRIAYEYWRNSPPPPPRVPDKGKIFHGKHYNLVSRILQRYDFCDRLMVDYEPHRVKIPLDYSKRYSEILSHGLVICRSAIYDVPVFDRRDEIGSFGYELRLYMFYAMIRCSHQTSTAKGDTPLEKLMTAALESAKTCRAIWRAERPWLTPRSRYRASNAPLSGGLPHAWVEKSMDALSREEYAWLMMTAIAYRKSPNDDLHTMCVKRHFKEASAE